MTISEGLRAQAARLHGIARARLRGGDAEAVHEIAALLEQRAERLPQADGETEAPLSLNASTIERARL